ncbi:MAG: hypothetical protein HY064_15665 [Bacteroidetes bacterium]|nr:hypothetical protein [Bacteroidota bacterium]
MANYKFQLNPKEPREDMIERHRDFGKVLHNYQKMTHPLYRTPLYRYRSILLGVLIVLTLTWMIVEFGGNQQEKKHRADSIRKSDSIAKEKTPNANR